MDLLFSDVVLPGGMTGADLAAEARRTRPGLRVLFTTGYARDAIVHDGRLDPGVELPPSLSPTLTLQRGCGRCWTADRGPWAAYIGNPV